MKLSLFLLTYLGVASAAPPVTPIPEPTRGLTHAERSIIVETLETRGLALYQLDDSVTEVERARLEGKAEAYLAAARFVATYAAPVPVSVPAPNTEPLKAKRRVVNGRLVYRK